MYFLPNILAFIAMFQIKLTQRHSKVTVYGKLDILLHIEKSWINNDIILLLISKFFTCSFQVPDNTEETKQYSHANVKNFEYIQLRCFYIASTLHHFVNYKFSIFRRSEFWRKFRLGTKKSIHANSSRYIVSVLFDHCTKNCIIVKFQHEQTIRSGCSYSAIT